MHLPKRLAVVITVMGFLFGVAGCPTSREAKIPTKTYDLPDGPEKVGGKKENEKVGTGGVKPAD